MSQPMMWTIPLGSKRSRFHESTEELYIESYNIEDEPEDRTEDKISVLLIKEVIKLERENRELRDRQFSLEMSILTGGRR